MCIRDSPYIVREFQSVIGIESRKQILEKTGSLPDYVIACVGGGSNAIGIFSGFIDDEKVSLIGVEASGKGLNTDKHAATLTKGSIGVLHGSMSYVLQDDYGQILEAHSISAGLDYPGVGPEHSFLKDQNRVEYVSIKDNEAVNAFTEMSKLEGIIPALETSHAIAEAIKRVQDVKDNQSIVVTLSGRGDKDTPIIAKHLGNNL